MKKLLHLFTKPKPVKQRPVVQSNGYEERKQEAYRIGLEILKQYKIIN